MKGFVRLRLEGLGAEKLMNALWEKGIGVQGLRRSKNRGVELEAAEKDRQTIVRLAEEKGFQVKVLNLGWKQKLWEVLCRRWGLVAGILLGAALCIGAMEFVWQVEILQAGSYAGEVRLFLAEKGIRPGILQKDVDAEGLQEELMFRLPRVKWVWVKKEGAVLSIRLEEGVAAQRQEDAPGPVVAVQDGILERLTVFSGTPVCKAGDSVKKGQVLILGEETGPDGEKVPVRARGEAVALVQVQSSVRLPTREMIAVPTGRQAERWLFQTPFGVYTYTEEPAFLMADRQYDRYPLPGVWLPVTLIRETFVECSGEWTERKTEDIFREGQKAAEEALIRAWPAAQNVDKSVKFSMIERGNVSVTAFAVLPMDIAQNGTTP